MKVLEEIKVSVYENVYSKKPRVMSFLEVIIMCIHPLYASIINAIRRYYAEGDHAAAQKLKNQLPCFTPAGTFDGDGDWLFFGYCHIQEWEWGYVLLSQAVSPPVASNVLPILTPA